MPRYTAERVDLLCDPRERIEPISMRIPDACRFTGIGRRTLYLLIARGEVEIIKLGNSTLVLTESLRRMIEDRRHREGPGQRAKLPLEAPPYFDDQAHLLGRLLWSGIAAVTSVLRLPSSRWQPIT